MDDIVSTSGISRPPLSPTRRYIEFASVLVVAASLAWFVWAHTDAQKLIAVFSHIAWPYYAAAIAALAVYQIFRTLRTRLLVDRGLGFFDLFLTLSLQCVVNAYFPAGLGELSTIYLLRRRHDVSVHLGTAALVLSRIADLVVFLVFFFLIIGLMARQVPPEVYLAMVSVAAVLLAATIALFVLQQIAGRYFSRWSEYGGAFGWLAHHGLIFVQAFAQLHRARDFLRLLALSGAMWLFHFLQWLFLLRAVGLALSPLEVLWVYVLFFPVSFLPLRGLAAMGPRIATWFFALQLVGVNETQAATAAFAVDILLQTLSTWIGVPPLLASVARTWRARG